MNFMNKIKLYIKSIFTKKKLMKSIINQYLFNEIFKPYTKKEIKRLFNES